MSGTYGERRKAAAGFTLLELLVAIFVLGFVLLMSSQGLQFGVHASRAVEADSRDDLLAADQALRRMIEAADPGVFPEPATLRGASDHLSMTTDLPSGSGGPLRHADAELAVVGDRLLLRWRPHLHAQWFGAGPAWTTTVVASGVARVAFAYFPRDGADAPQDWASSWTGERLPGFVRLQIEFAAGTGRRWPPIIASPLREPVQE